MIRIIIEHKDKRYELTYNGTITMFLCPPFLDILWYNNDTPPENDNDLMVWCSNRYDKIFLNDIVEIINE